MIYVNIAGYIAVAMGGMVIGAIYGRRVAANAASLAHSIETRLAAVEHAVRGPGKDTSAQHAAATEHHASAIEKLAGAIEKHAAAVDDHGAATVAAAVESRAGLIAPAAVAAVKS